MKVLLLCLLWRKYGGWPTYTKHLRAALEAVGIDVTVKSIDSPTGAKDWVSKLTNWEELNKYDLTHIVVGNDKCFKTYKDKLNGVPFIYTIHDPAEIKSPESVNVLASSSKSLIVCIRESFLLLDKVYKVDQMKYIPHPYKRESDGIIRGDRIVCTSRIDFDKNIDLILAADCGIELFGGGVNRIYEYHNLRKIYKGGLAAYPNFHNKGFENPSDVYKNACVLVDMSTICNDGGGTQYTFLEAMDYGLDMLLNGGWHTGNKDELKKFIHYSPINSVVELRSMVKACIQSLGRVDNREKYKDILETHDHVKIGKIYKKTYEDWLNGTCKETKLHKIIQKQKLSNTGIGKFLNG